MKKSPDLTLLGTALDVGTAFDIMHFHSFATSSLRADKNSNRYVRAVVSTKVRFVARFVNSVRTMKLGDHDTYTMRKQMR